jgi:hypothetical protein
MVNVPVFGTPGDQSPRITFADAQVGIGFRAVGRLGTASKYEGVVTLDVMDELLGSASAGTAAEVIALGASGTIWNVQTGKGIYKYTSDQNGKAYPYRCRSDLSASGQFLDTDATYMEIVINYGQSWVTNVSVAGDLPAIMLTPTEMTITFAPVNSDGTFSHGIGLPGSYVNVVDFRGVSNANTTGNQLGLFTSISRVRQMRDASLDVRPIADVCPAYPGLIWPGLEPGTGPWTALVAMAAFSVTIAQNYGLTARFRMIRWTDGTESNLNGTSEYADLTAFLAAVDALELNAGGSGELVTIFGDQTPIYCTGTQASLGCLDQVQFALDNPGRYVNIGPRYAYTCQDYIHHDRPGSAHLSEIRGFIEMAVLEQSLSWTAMHIIGVYIQGNTITVDVNQPLEGFYGSLHFETDYIEAAAQYGFRLQQNGADVALSGIAFSSATRIVMTTAGAPLATTDTIAFSYAFYGPGKPIATHSGAWGNVAMAMAPSLYFEGESILAWLAIYLQTLTSANFVAPPALPAVTSIIMSSQSVQANQTTVSNFATLSVTETGQPGAITYSLDNSSGGYFSILSNTTVQAIAGLPAGTFTITIRATPANGQPFTQDFPITSS